MKPNVFWYGNSRMGRALNCRTRKHCRCDDCRDDRTVKMRKRERIARKSQREQES